MTHTLCKWTVALVGTTLLALLPFTQGWAEEGKMMSCPADMVDQGEYCIDREPQDKLAHWYKAADTCEQRDERLCENKEWLDACDAFPHNGILQMPNKKSEWLNMWVFETTDKVFDSVDRGYYRCRTGSGPRPSDWPLIGRPFRCCVSK
ncbi:MAG TPA: hypothetical protein EYG58_05950 [Nitrospirales bacterium]|nr:hypothetical protein [Nitrospirales bacterium]HIN32539.1 hypothetical protein [Nitrospirales bacterium]HIO70073.1 hypothetical protein [Nitrospirales bacterium]